MMIERADFVKVSFVVISEQLEHIQDSVGKCLVNLWQEQMAKSNTKMTGDST